MRDRFDVIQKITIQTKAIILASLGMKLAGKDVVLSEGCYDLAGAVPAGRCNCGSVVALHVKAMIEIVMRPGFNVLKPSIVINEMDVIPTYMWNSVTIPVS